jgi:DNA-directed RNA polymerase subunit RPC12/RpoP
MITGDKVWYLYWQYDTKTVQCTSCGTLHDRVDTLEQEDMFRCPLCKQRSLVYKKIKTYYKYSYGIIESIIQTKNGLFYTIENHDGRFREDELFLNEDNASVACDKFNKYSNCMVCCGL